MIGADGRSAMRLAGVMARHVLALAAALIVAASAPAAAQSRLANAFSGFSVNSDKPIDIASDVLEVLDEEQLAIFKGNVNVVQGEVTLKTKVLKVSYDGRVNGGGQQQIRRLEALGKVLVETKDQTVTGDHAVFEMKQNIITVDGDVVLTQGGNVLRGSKLVVDLNTSRSRLEAHKSGKGGRVTGSFVPSSPRPGEGGEPPAPQ
ncbi:MAG: LptA/OstA family protein [Hyphomicrobiales bacterium]|nr:LptA/OstA family protein [Hyphomicrobiales bacterium]